MSILGKTKGKPISRIQFDALLKRFIVFLKRQLNISYDIPLILIDDAEYAKKIRAFGFMSDKNIVYISVINRHPVDILRTVAHEYVHYKQHMERGPSLSGNQAGSPLENQANAKAGELMRRYGQLHPELFDFMTVR
jgi:Zn-dependent peptidase ImmA (M78 family)